MDNVEMMGYIFLFIVLTAFGALFIHTANGCNGKLVQGVVWFECIEE